MIQILGRIVILKGTEYEQYKKSKIRELELIGERNDLKDEVAEKDIRISRNTVGDKYKKQLIDIDIGDPSPTDVVKRKEYVAEVAGLHRKILEPKLRQMISVSHNLSEAVSSEREFDLVMKGVVYAFREILKWGESMVSEQVANQVGQNPSSPDDNKSNKE